MRKKSFILIIVAVILACLMVSCERDPQYEEGEYVYENHTLNYINGFRIQWGSDDLSYDIRKTVMEIVKSMVLVKGGTYAMGSNSSFSFPDEKPIHWVSLSDFFLAKVTITQKQWASIMGENPLWNQEYGKGDNYPANFISYEEAMQFVDKLNKYSGLEFRMPTEAEWEYAACGGIYSQGYLYSGSNNVNEVAWCKSNSNGKMHLIATLSPNELGLNNMSGNVWEWCSDWYGNYTGDSANNPTGPSSGVKRVVRGGSFTYDANYCRCKVRNSLPETNRSLAVGLRLATSANESE